MRCFPVIRELPRTLAQIGPVISMAASFCIDKPFDDKSRLYSRGLGGGVLYDLGVYPLNLAHILFGLDGCRLESEIVRGKSGVDEEVTLTLTYPGRAVATFTCSFRRADAHRAVIKGKRGEVILEDFFHPSRVTVRPQEGAPVVTEHTYPIMGYHFEIDEVIHCLENGASESDLMPLAYTREVLEVVERALGI
jgi:predicted dehydrogenase